MKGGDIMAYTYKNSKGQTYYLNSSQVKLRGGGSIRTIYYFSKEPKKPIDELPEGFGVLESPKTGLPFLKKK